MPAQTNGLILQAQPSEELTCRAHNLPKEHPDQPRGSVSYYATTALSEVGATSEWLARIEELVQRDVDAGHLSPFHRPRLQLLGDGSQPIF